MLLRIVTGHSKILFIYVWNISDDFAGYMTQDSETTACVQEINSYPKICDILRLSLFWSLAQCMVGIGGKAEAAAAPSSGAFCKIIRLELRSQRWEDSLYGGLNKT